MTTKVMVLGLALALAASAGCGGKSGDAPQGSATGTVAAKGSAGAAKKKSPAADLCFTRPGKPEESGFAANHLIGIKDSLWEPGMTLNVVFTDGAPELHEVVKKYAPDWSKYANIQFAFFEKDNPPPTAHIVITMQIDPEANGQCSFYSNIGTASPIVARQKGHSMRLGCLEDLPPEQQYRKVVHEFGHALGMLHEHQRKGMDWNEDAVVKIMCQEQMGWDEKMCRDQILTPIESEIPAHALVGTPYDPNSIMHYPFEGRFMKDGKDVGGSLVLSELDKRGIAELYPKTSGSPGAAPGTGGSVAELRNTAEASGSETQWTLYVGGAADRVEHIKSVLYILHPSIVPSEGTGDASKPGHPLGGSSNQPFMVRAMVTYDDGSAELLKHELDFQAGSSPTPVGSPAPAAASSPVPTCETAYPRLKKCIASKASAADIRALDDELEAIRRIGQANASRAQGFDDKCKELEAKLSQAGC